MFFTRNRLADRWILLTTRLPSNTTDGIHAKLDSNNTTCAAWHAASLPDAIATLQSASLSASTSLTPSPVMATVFPWSFNAWTNWRFCPGVTRPNTVYFAIAFAISSSVWSVVASTYSSAFTIPASFATSDTVSGLSPEITLTSTPCSAKYANVSGASLRIGFARRTYAIGRTFPVNFPPSNAAS